MLGGPVPTLHQREEKMNSRRFTVPLAIVLALAITPSLTGCFGNPIQQLVEGATGGNVDLGGAGLPDGFPSADVPIVDGDIIYGMGLGNADGKVWNVTIKVEGLDVVGDIKSQLEDAGFTANEAGIGGATDDGATLLYESDKYGVLVVVSKDSDNGVVANYTVSETK